MLSFKPRKLDDGKNRENGRNQKYFHNFGRESEDTRNLSWCSQRLELKIKMILKEWCGIIEWTHLCHVGFESRDVVKTLMNFLFFTRRRIS